MFIVCYLLKIFPQNGSTQSTCKVRSICGIGFPQLRKLLNHNIDLKPLLLENPIVQKPAKPRKYQRWALEDRIKTEVVYRFPPSLYASNSNTNISEQNKSTRKNCIQLKWVQKTRVIYKYPATS